MVEYLPELARSKALVVRLFTRLKSVQLATATCVLVLGLAALPAVAATCQFAPASQMDKDTGVEPQLLIDGACTDPVYNESTFVITKTEELTLQVPDGPLIPYTEVSGHFPATITVEALPEGVRQSPTTFQQNYVLRFPAKEFWQNRSFEGQHPTGGGVVDNRMAFTNGAFSVNWMSASVANAVASHRHEAAATKVAKAYANKLYGNTAKIYSYFWGCSGGGTVAMAAAENVTGVWDGVQPQCIGTSGDAPSEPEQSTANSPILHFALATTDTRAAVEHVRQAGYEITAEPRTVDLNGMGVTFAFFKGPNGEEIEFFQTH